MVSWIKICFFDEKINVEAVSLLYHTTLHDCGEHGVSRAEPISNLFVCPTHDIVNNLEKECLVWTMI